MKKILYIITQSEFGGAQRYIFDLATHIKNEFEVIVAAGENPDGELFQRLKSKNIEGRYLSHLKRRLNPFRDIIAIFQLRRLIKKERPDIIHLNSSKAGVLGSLAARTVILNDSEGSHKQGKAKRMRFFPRNKCGVRMTKKIKVVYTVHGWVFNEPMGWLRRLTYFLAEKLTEKFKDKIICVSDCDRRIAIKRGFSERKLLAIHNGLDFDSLKFLEKAGAKQELLKKIDSDLSSKKLIGTIANLYQTKGIEYLIEAAHYCLNETAGRIENDTLETSRLHSKNNTLLFERPRSIAGESRTKTMMTSRLHSKNNTLLFERPRSIAGESRTKTMMTSRLHSKDEIMFIVIGEGPERKKLEELIKQCDLEANFFLLGHIPDARQYLKAFDVFVLPSVKEGFPYAILEAMAAGLPIVASEVGGLPEMACLRPASINERTDLTEPAFLLTEPKNSQQLAENILYLLNNPEAAARLAGKAQEIVRISFGLTQMIRKTTEVYIW